MAGACRVSYLARAFFRVGMERVPAMCEGSAMDVGSGNEYTPSFDVELDLRGVICPYNFVKTKLKLEAMQSGQVLALILDDGDPIKNVPASLANEGHTILSQTRCSPSAYRVLVKKREEG